MQAGFFSAEIEKRQCKTGLTWQECFDEPEVRENVDLESLQKHIFIQIRYQLPVHHTRIVYYHVYCSHILHTNTELND